MDQDGENQAEDEIHQMETNSLVTFLTKEEHENAYLKRGEMPQEETEDLGEDINLLSWMCRNILA